MKFTLLACLAAQLLLCNCRFFSKLPHPCSKSDPDVERCLWKATEQLKYHLAAYNIPAVDPYERDIFYIKKDFLYVNLDAVLKNLKITGWLKYHVDDLKADIKNLQGEVSVNHPQIKVQSDFIVKANVLDVPFEFSGSVAAELVDVKTNVSASFHTQFQETITKYVLDDLEIKTRVGNMQALFTAANPKEQAIADFRGKTFTENDRGILDVLTATLNSILEDFIRERVTDILVTISADRLLTE